MPILKILLASLIILTLAACGTTKTPPYSGVKIGKPYAVKGKVYVPHYDPNYDEIGIASWYGPGFHGEHTASGERYDQDGISAAHKTLPLPSLVRVTNLENGRSAIIKVNDRGPFVADRIIDLSKGAAIKLGVYQVGTAKVRVQFLDQETREYVSNLPNGAKSLATLDKSLERTREVPVASVDKAEVIEVTEKDIEDNTAVEEISKDDEEYDDAPLPFVAPPLVLSKNAHLPNNTTPLFVAPTQTIATQQTIESKEKFSIQAGTFSIRENAQKRVGQLSNLCHASIVQTQSGGKTLYRVVTESFNSLADAKKLLSKLDSMGISDARLIKN